MKVSGTVDNYGNLSYQYIALFTIIYLFNVENVLIFLNILYKKLKKKVFLIITKKGFFLNPNSIVTQSPMVARSR